MYYSKERGSVEFGIKFDNEHAHCSINYTTILKIELEFDLEVELELGI